MRIRSAADALSYLLTNSSSDTKNSKPERELMPAYSGQKACGETFVPERCRSYRLLMEKMAMS